MAEKRSSFTGKIGFVLAAAGSAVGLGNIWRFPYLAAQYGGGIFLLVYIILAVTLGFALMSAEVAIGRKTGKSAIAAFADLNKKYTFIGWMASVVPMLILPYYCVIGGWVVKYFYVYISGAAEQAATSDYFSNFISAPFEPIGWFLLFLGLTALIVLLGVEKGVEKVSKVMMPVLVVLTLGVAIYVICQPGAIEGVKYYLIPNFEHFSVMTVLAAMGQLFYSMSLAMGIMITYGSYMKKDINLESSVRQIEVFDTAIAFLAGMMVIPSVFFLSGGETPEFNQGPGLMFITLPGVFDTMTGGTVVGLAFFVLVFFAALTSSISLMETVVSIICDKTHLSRRAVCFIVLGGCILLGLPSCLGFGPLDFINIAGNTILDMFDIAMNNILMPIVALLTCIFVGYVLKPKTLIEEMEIGGRFRSKKLFEIVIKYFAPICIVLILVSSLLNVLGIVKI